MLTALIVISVGHAIVHDWFIDSRARDIQQTIHRQVMEKSAPAPIQYRIFVPYLAELLMKCGFSFASSYLFIRITFTFLAGYLFYIFLCAYFSSGIGIIGTLFFFSVLPLTYIRYYMQPMDIPNLFFFLVGYLIILKRKDWLLLPVIFVAMLNRETAILLVLVYVFYRWDEMKLPSLLIKTSLMGITGLGVYWLLRKFFTLKSYYSDLFYLQSNLTDERTYLYAILLFGPFLFYAFRQVWQKPKFLVRASLMIPFFLIIHYTMTIMVEPRLWLPILPIIIALGLWSIAPENMKITQPAVVAVKRSYGKSLYLSLLALFTIFFYFFFAWYKTAHLKNRRIYLQTEKLILESKRYLSAGWLDAAVETLNKAIAINPESDELHYQLGIVYNYYLYNPEKALYHFKKCLEINPYHLDGKRISGEIERLTYLIERKNKL